ncbi:hypothetical protein HZB88_02130 [archaeon]|nr:hypothetical protein [archaeon]
MTYPKGRTGSERFELPPDFKSDFVRKIYNKLFSNTNTTTSVEPVTEENKNVSSNVLYFPKGSQYCRRDEDIKENTSENYNSRKICLDDLVKYFSRQGVVDEDALCILGTFCLINAMSLGIEGYSGSGKSFIMEKILSLVPEEYVYKIGTSSDKALFYNADEIANKKIVYIPEIQKLITNKNSTILEIIKDITENKDAERLVVQHNSLRKYKLSGSLTIVYTLAFENNFKLDAETARRVVHLRTNTSQEHIEKILYGKAQKRFFNSNGQKNLQDNQLKQHIKDCISLEANAVDPFFSLYNLFPKSPKTAGFIDKYYGLLDACAKFHHKERISYNGNIFLSLQDHMLIYKLYYQTFCGTILELTRGSFKEDNLEFSNEIPDWQNITNTAINFMQQSYPDIVDRWYKQQIV